MHIPFEWATVATGAAVFVAAGVVKGIVGLGLPTVAMALLALSMTPADAAALLILPSFVSNVWQIRPWSALAPLVRRLGPMLMWAFAGTLFGALWFGAPAGAWAGMALGVALCVYAAWGLASPRLAVPRGYERWLAPVVGVATGIVTAATGVFAVPAVPYLLALGFGRDDLIRAMGLSFTVSTLALALGLYVNASYTAASLSASLLMLPPALAGMAAGQWLRRRLSPTAFRTCFLGSLALLGSYMIVRAW